MAEIRISKLAKEFNIGLSTVIEFLQKNGVSVAEKIQDAIEPLIATRTSILIAHRLSTILAADEILVLKDGAIVERGTHGTLVKAGGVYTELYETQFTKAIQKAAAADT